jgi:hypothetical protein
MATTYNEDGTSKTTSNTNRGMTAWMPPQRKKKEEKPKTESLIERMKRRRDETNKLIDMM